MMHMYDQPRVTQLRQNEFTHGRQAAFTGFRAVEAATNYKGVLMS